MISDRNKKIFFVILLLVAVAIWAHNLGVLSDDETFYSPQNRTIATKTAKAADHPDVPYMEPRINPFKGFGSDSPQKSAVPPLPAQHEGRSKIPQEVSSIYIFDGFVIGSPSSQAILRNASGQNIIITAGDSLTGWEVRKIGSDCIVFSSGDFRDTLRLRNASPEK